MIVQITAAKPEDTDALTAIAFAAKRHWRYPEHWIQQWSDLLTVTSEYIRAHPTLAAIDNNEIVGFCSLTVVDEVAALDHLWVKPSAMGRGIGRLLFDQIEGFGRDAGASFLKIESDPHAEGFYHRMGATTIGREPAFMDGHERYLPVLEKRLS